MERGNEVARKEMKECGLDRDLSHQHGPSGMVTGTGSSFHRLYTEEDTHLSDVASS